MLDNIVVERTKTESSNKAQLADASPSNQQISKANERAIGYFIKYLKSKEGHNGEFQSPLQNMPIFITLSCTEKEEEREKKRDENEPDEELTALARTKALKLWRDLFR